MTHEKLLNLSTLVPPTPRRPSRLALPDPGRVRHYDVVRRGGGLARRPGGKDRGSRGSDGGGQHGHRWSRCHCYGAIVVVVLGRALGWDGGYRCLSAAVFGASRPPLAAAAARVVCTGDRLARGSPLGLGKHTLSSSSSLKCPSSPIAPCPHPHRAASSPRHGWTSGPGAPRGWSRHRRPSSRITAPPASQRRRRPRRQPRQRAAGAAAEEESGRRKRAAHSRRAVEVHLPREGLMRGAREEAGCGATRCSPRRG